MVLLKALFMTSLALSATQLKASDCIPGEPCRFEFEEREEANCQDLNAEMSKWFKSAPVYTWSKKDAAPIEKRLGPVRNQGSVGWCFAYAAAEMLTYETGYNISSAQVAKIYFEKSRIAWIWGGKEGGFINDALDLSYNKELCEEKDFPSKGIVDVETTKKMNCSQPITIITNLKTKVYTGKGNPGGASLFPELDRILEEGKIAGIHYNANKLLFGESSNLKNAWANHASTIVSRYFDKEKKSCRYIIRNTWGKGCLTSAKSKAICKDGYYSVSESDLHESLAQVIETKERN